MQELQEKKKNIYIYIHSNSKYLELMTFWIDHNHNLIQNEFQDLVLLEAPRHLSSPLKEQDNNVAKLKHFKITTFL